MTNYKLNDEKMFADVTDGVAIIINSETGIYYGMNSFGTNVYENIVNGASIEDILAKLKTIGATNDIEKEFNKFVQIMLDKELIISADSSSSEVTIDEDIAKEDNFELSINEYNDAQEMLLTDPIHEVKEETGWTPEKESIGYTKEETIEREKKAE
mgnify:FL=1